MKLERNINNKGRKKKNILSIEFFFVFIFFILKEMKVEKKKEKNPLAIKFFAIIISRRNELSFTVIFERESDFVVVISTFPTSISTRFPLYSSFRFSLCFLNHEIKQTLKEIFP